MPNQKEYLIVVDVDMLMHEMVIAVVDKQTEKKAEERISLHKYDESNPNQLSDAFYKCLVTLNT